ncbi:sterol carrier family protein [Nocardia sp. CA-290969]|uniref:sterol carrier family protein n=1 Tax=Nocardia sp. CA-290969 TaxID=3239986 RepID=UPI003D90C4E5
MARRTEIDPAEVRSAVLAVRAWLFDSTAPAPARPELAAAVRGTARALAAAAPGHSVEVRVPPFVAVQCVEGPRHTRGTPPNVVETDPRTWLLLATGLSDFTSAVAAGTVDASGSRAAEIARLLPLCPLPAEGPAR